MEGELPRWEDLLEESLRPEQRAERYDLHLTWLEGPGGTKRKKTPRGLTDEELDHWLRRLLGELSTRREAQLTVARLAARHANGKEDVA